MKARRMSENCICSWSMAIDDVIMNILVKSKMKRAIDELEIMYIQDVMTGLFNRADLKNMQESSL